VSLAPIPSSPADLELIAQLRSKLQYAELRIRVLEERLRLMRIEKYGAGGEKLPQAQMQLFELEPVVSERIEPEEPWCSISAWVADAMGQSGSWESSKVFSKQTGMPRTTRSAGREWYTLHVGLMQEGSFSRRCS
jgi:hypothetical protein